MGTGMNDRSFLFDNLGAMYGTLIFFDSLLGQVDKDRDSVLSGAEKALISEAKAGVSRAAEGLEKLHQMTESDDLGSFVAGLGKATSNILKDVGRR